MWPTERGGLVGFVDGERGLFVVKDEYPRGRFRLLAGMSPPRVVPDNRVVAQRAENVHRKAAPKRIVGEFPRG